MLLFSDKFPRLLEAANAIDLARQIVAENKTDCPHFEEALMIDLCTRAQPLLEQAVRELRASKERLPDSVKSMITPSEVFLAANMPAAAARALQDIFLKLV